MGNCGWKVLWALNFLLLLGPGSAQGTWEALLPARLAEKSQVSARRAGGASVVGGSPGDISPQMLWFRISVGVSCTGAVAGGWWADRTLPSRGPLPASKEAGQVHPPPPHVETLLSKLKGSILLPGKQTLMKGSEGSELSGWSPTESEARPPCLIQARGTQWEECWAKIYMTACGYRVRRPALLLEGESGCLGEQTIPRKVLSRKSVGSRHGGRGVYPTAESKSALSSAV